MASENPIERRPDHDGRSLTAFPAEWGTPPLDAEERSRWIVRSILDGEERRMRGEFVAWLASRERR